MKKLTQKGIHMLMENLYKMNKKITDFIEFREESERHFIQVLKEWRDKDD